MKITLGQKAIFLIVFILVLDQVIKIWVKTHMVLGDFDYPIFGSWFVFRFQENPGMAYGMEFGGHLGKLLLSLFRIVAVFGIGWYLIYLVRTKAHQGLVLSIGLIFAGAIGNLIDSAFYGMIFNDSYHHVAQLFAKDHYGTFLHGRVVDMLHFSIQDHMPSWLSFLSFIFNVSDASITIGVIIILLFQKRFFAKD